MDTTTRIQGYGQDRPCEESAVQSLSELLGPDVARDAWSAAAERAGIRPPVNNLDNLGDVARELVRSERPVIRVAGRSLLVRIGTYRALAGMVRRTA